MLINDPEYKCLILEVTIKFRNNNQTVLKNKRDLAKSETEDAKAANQILRIADKFAVELEAAATARGECNADARLLVWDDVDAVNNESMEF